MLRSLQARYIFDRVNDIEINFPAVA